MSFYLSINLNLVGKWSTELIFMSQVENCLGEEFSETYNKIVDCIGTMASELGANSGVMTQKAANSYN
jgi:hypothetical protein